MSAILLAAIAFSLFMAVVSLSKVQYEEGITPLTLPFWGVYLPIGLHGGWTLAGETKVSKWVVEGGGAGVRLCSSPCDGLLDQ